MPRPSLLVCILKYLTRRWLRSIAERLGKETMSRMISLNVPAQIPVHHASEEEYSVFVQAYATCAKHRTILLRKRRYFVQRYPDLRSWFAAPLAERVGRLYGEDAPSVFSPVSYQARTYLLFLALCGYAPLDWEWLIAVPALVTEKMLNSSLSISNCKGIRQENPSPGPFSNLGWKQ